LFLAEGKVDGGGLFWPPPKLPTRTKPTLRGGKDAPGRVGTMQVPGPSSTSPRCVFSGGVLPATVVPIPGCGQARPRTRQRHI